MNEKCACLKVDYMPILNEDGSRTEQWMCLDCKSIFVRKRSVMCEADSNAVLADVLAEIKAKGYSEDDYYIEINEDDLAEILGRYFS